MGTYVKNQNAARSAGLTEDEIDFLVNPVTIADYGRYMNLSNDQIKKKISTGDLRGVTRDGVLWVGDTKPRTTASSGDGWDDVAISAVKRLVTGEVGLPKTYWVYGVLGPIVWAVTVTAIDPDRYDGSMNLWLFAFAVYMSVVWLGIWKAAIKYKGPSIWAVLAKFAVLISAIPTAIKTFQTLIS